MDDGILQDLTPSSGADPGPGVEPARPWTRDWPVWALLGLDWAFGAWLWTRLPALVPVHWNAALVPDGWGPAAFPAFGLPAIVTASYLLLVLGGALGLDPSPSHVRGGHRLLLPAFLAAVHLGLYAPMGLHPAAPPPGAGILYVLVALLTVLLGNLMPRLEPRTRNRGAWKPALRVGGRVTVAAGLLQLACLGLPAPIHGVLVLATLVAAALVPSLLANRAAGPALPRPDTHEGGPSARDGGGPWLHPADLLALLGEVLLLGALCLRARGPQGGLQGLGHAPSGQAPSALPLLPASALLLALLPPLVWGLLLLEARLRAGGELRRARTALRGWLVLAVGLSWLPALFLSGGAGSRSLPRVLSAIAILVLVAWAGQWLTRRRAPEDARELWPVGPTLWDPSDPRVLVPKLSGMGLTCNFAQLASWLFLLALLLVSLASVA
jgi:hypothetical protein